MAFRLLSDGAAKSHLYNVALAQAEIGGGDGNIRCLVVLLL